MHLRSTAKQLILPIACALISIALYIKSALVVKHFVHDEKIVILKNPDVIGLTPIWSIFMHDYSGNPLEADGFFESPTDRSFRPIAVLSFRLTHALYGMSPRIFRFENVILYAV